MQVQNNSLFIFNFNMKYFLKYIAIFLTPIVIIAIGSELLLRKIPNDYQVKKQYLDRNSDKVEVLYLGNSHVLYGINPALSQYNSFNAAYVSQSLYFDEQILKKYNANWKNLKYIVLPIDYFSLYWKLEESVESWRVKNYTMYWDIHKQFNLSLNFEITTNNLSNNLKRIDEYYRRRISNVNCTQLGYGTNYDSKSPQNQVQSGIEAAKRHLIIDKSYFNENVEHLKNIISFAQNKELTIILITSPAYKTYYNNIDTAQLNRTLYEVEKIKKNNDNVHYFNFFKDANFLEQDFYDADHLNKMGSQKLTKIMDSIIDELN